MNELNANVWKGFRDFVQKGFGLGLTEAQIDLFKIYLNELKIWNEKFNLVSFKTDQELIYRHFADSLSALKYLSPGKKDDYNIVDLGAGAGFPGIPLKIALPRIQLTLIESIKKKCDFLENLVSKLSVDLTEIVNDRAENIGQNRNFREKFDVAVSRAFAKFSPNLEMGLPLVKKGGQLILYKTESSAFGKEGVSSVEKALGILCGKYSNHFCYELPGQALKYCILVFEKTEPSSKQYPRKVGVPEKKQL